MQRLRLSHPGGGEVTGRCPFERKRWVAIFEIGDHVANRCSRYRMPGTAHSEAARMWRHVAPKTLSQAISLGWWIIALPTSAFHCLIVSQFSLPATQECCFRNPLAQQEATSHGHQISLSLSLLNAVARQGFRKGKTWASAPGTLAKMSVIRHSRTLPPGDVTHPERHSIDLQPWCVTGYTPSEGR